jgi:N-acetylmuramoyl-L-alanine amidase
MLKHAVVFLFIFLSAVSLSAAAPDAQLQSMKARYLKLRNTDVRISRPAEWRALAQEFEDYVGAYPKDAQAPSALLNASILYEELGHRLDDKQLLINSVRLLKQLTDGYQGHELADDALIRRGDLLRRDLDDKVGASSCYHEVIASYPQSDMLDVARARLKELEKSGSTAEASSPKAGPEARQETSLKQDAEHGRRDHPVVVIDPGHGGEDYGAVGRGELLEKDVTLAVALELEELLIRNLGAVVRLTRRTDVFAPLAERTNLANDFDADIFVSLHTNASPTGKASGIETYYLDNTGDKASQTLAERENKSANLEGAGSDLSFMLSDLIQNAKLEDSVRLARSVQKAAVGWLTSKWQGGSRNLGVKKAPFYVLVGAHMPCILVEMGFIDHPVDGVNLGEKDYRKDLAYGIFLGLKYFLQK